jgi:photosystem II stability/assembly factor-like uncharacterized protein
MNNKIAIGILIFILAPLVFAFRVPKAKYPPSTLATNEKVVKACLTNAKDVKAGASNLIFLSNDGGQTWEDISLGLPENVQPQDFFAGESELYMRVKNIMYRSKSDLSTPVWQKEDALDPQCTSIAFNRTGVMAYNYDGKIFKKVSSNTWLPLYTSSERNTMRSVFETSDGAVFLGCDDGLFKSTDKGQHWKRVQNEGWVMDIVESKGVLVATGQKGIMRSTDNGEHWDWVISEGGVGIAVEKIDGGFAAISYNTTIQSRRIHISTDNGQTWKAIDQGLPLSPSITSIKQIGKFLICGHPEGIFRSSDMGKTWNMVLPNVNRPFTIPLAPTDNAKVLKLYTSGYKLYAVARNEGC